MSWADTCSNCGSHRADCECGDWNGYKKNKKNKRIKKRTKKTIESQTNKEMPEYRVIAERDLASLAFKVNDLLRDGWKCQGGIGFFFYPPEGEGSTVSYNPYIWHTQALIKELKP